MSATIFPTGVTIYNPEKCWSGYTIFQAAERGALLIDMNGNEVRMWEGLQGFPNKMLPGGYVMGSLGERNPKYGLQDQTDLVQVDWDGNIVWKFDKAEYIEDPGEEPQWMASTMTTSAKATPWATMCPVPIPKPTAATR